MDTTAREVIDLIDEIVREASSIKESLDRTLEALEGE